MQRALAPDVGQRLDQPVDIIVRMHRAGRDAQAFGADRNGRVIDWLDVNAVVFHQPVADHLGLLGIADHDRDDVTGVFDLRDAGGAQRGADSRDAFLLAFALERRFLEMANAGQRPGGNRRRQCRCKNEARGKAAHEIAHRLGSGDVAANDSKGLAERAFDHRQPVHQAFAFGNAATARAVHANGMDFIDIGHRAMLFADFDDLLDRRDVAIHRIDRFEGDQLGPARLDAGEQPVEIFDIIMLELQAFGAAVADAFDHRGMIERVREYDTIGQLGRQRAKRRPVRDIARGEQQRVFLAMQVGEFDLELAMRMHGTRDIARATGAGTGAIEFFMHRFDHGGMLPHAEIIIGAPDGNFLLLAIFKVARRARIFTLATLQLGEHTVISAFLQAIERSLKMGFIIHLSLPNAYCPLVSGAASVFPFLVISDQPPLLSEIAGRTRRCASRSAQRNRLLSCQGTTKKPCSMKASTTSAKAKA